MKALEETPCKPVIGIKGKAWRAVLQGLITAADKGCQCTPQILQ